MKPRILSAARLSLPLATAIAALLAASSAHAVSNSWAADAAGSWATAASWTGGVNIPGSTTTDNADVATFSNLLTAGRAVTVDTTRYIGGITFGATNTSTFGYTLQTGTLRLNSGSVIQTTGAIGANTNTISSPIIISGATTAAATFTSSPTTAANGRISVTGTVTGSATAATTTSLTLNGTGTGANAISGIIQNGAGGALSVVKSGTGTWTLSGANTFTGALDIAAGRLRVSSAAAAGSNATINSNSTSTATVFAATSGTAISFSKSFSLNTGGGAITFGDTTGTGDLTFTNNLTRASGSTNRTVNVAGSTTVNFNGNLLSPGATSTTTFTKGGTGTLAIKGTGSGGDLGFSGVIVTGGTVAVTRLADLGSASSLGTATNATPGAVSITLDGGTLRYITGGAAASSTDRVLQVGRTTAAAVGTILNDATSAAETVTFSNANAIAYGTAGQTRTLVLGGTNTGNNTFASTIGDNGAGAVSLTKQDAGAWLLTGSNTYTGTTSLTGGTLVLSGTGSVNNSSGITVNGSTAKLLQTSSVAASSPVTLTQGTLTGNGTVNTVSVGNATGGIISNNDGVPGSALTIGSLTFNGAATVNTFHAAGDFTPAVAATGISTNLAGAVTLNPNASFWTNGTYSLMSYGGGSIGGAGTGQIVLGTVSGLSARQTPVYADTGSALQITISGDTPKWTGLDGGSWQTGSTGASENWTLIAGGTPTSFLASDDVLFDDTAAGTTVLDISAANVAPFATTFNNSTLNYTVGSTGGFGISSGALTKAGNGSLTFTNANTYTGNTTISGGVLDVSTDGAQLYSGASPVAAVVTVNNGGALVVRQFGQGNTTGTGSPSLGNLLNSGGQVVIDGGTLRFNNETGSRGRVTNVGPNGATFDVVNNSSYIWTTSPGTSVPFSGTGQTLALTGDASSTGQINLVIGGTGVSIVKNGDCKWTLAGNNTYNGGTTVNSGTLQATVTTTANGLGSGTVAVGSGTTVILNNTATSGTIPVNNTFTGTGLSKLQFAANTTARNTQMPNVTGFNGTIQLSNLGSTGDKWNVASPGISAPGATVQIDSGSTLYLPGGSSTFAGIIVNGTGNSEGRGAIRHSASTLNTDISLASDATYNMDSAAAVLNGNITSGAAGSQTLTLGATASTGGTLSGIIGGGTGTLNLTTAVGGTYTLTNANTYTGSTLVSAGTLALGGSGSINSTSGINVSGGGAKLLQTSSTAVTPVVTLTQGTVTGNGTVDTVNVGDNTGGIVSNNNGVAGAALTVGTLTFDGAATVNTFSNSTSATIVTTTLASNAAGLVTINPTSAAWTPGTTYNLISYTGGSVGGAGAAQFTLGTTSPSLPARQAAALTDTGSSIALAITGDSPYWVGDGDGKWNLASTNNWKLLTGGTYTEFLANDAVLFDDNASGAGPVNVDIDTTNVAPFSTTFNNITKSYVLGSTGGFGISSGSLTKDGTANLTISSANTYTGPTTINAGTVILGGAGTIGSASALTMNGGALDLGTTSQTTGAVSITAPAASGDTIGNGSLTGTSYAVSNGSGTVVVSANLLASGGFTKTGTGTVELAGANTYTGLTSVREGVLTLSGNRSVAPTANPSIDVGGSGSPLGTLNLQADLALAATQFRVGANGPGTTNQTTGALTFTGGSQLTVGVTSGMVGIYNLSGGSVSTVAVANRGLIVGVNADCNGTFNLSGTGTLTMAPTSVLMVGRSENVAATGTSAAFNQTGGLATAGELRIGGNTAANNANQTALLDLSGGTFSAVSFTALSGGNGSSSTINIGGTADVTLPAFPTARGTGATATLNLDGGTLRPAAASTAYMGGLTNAFIKAGGAKIDTGFDITISQALLEDAISTGGGLTKEGTSALTLQGSNTYTGVTNVNAGIVAIANPNALGTTAGNTVVASGARLFPQSGVTNQNVPEPIILSGTGTDGTGALRFGGGVTAVEMSGPITLAADALIKNDGSTTSTFSGGFSIADKVLTFTADSGATNTVGTAGISGSTGSVVKTGPGTLTLAAAGTYSGDTSHEGGILNVNDSNALGSGTAILNGGIRYVIGDGVNVANAFTLGANAGTAGNGLIQVATGTTGTVSGPITITSGAAGGGHFASAGTGILNITGQITSTVAVANRNGTVVHSGGGTGYTATNAGQGTVRLGANDGIATTATMTIASSAAASFDLAGFNQTMVGIAKGASAATIGNSSTTSDSTLTTTGTSTFAGVIQDALGSGTMKVNLTVVSGQLTLTGANTYTGATAVTGGTLALVGGSQASPISVGSGASLGFTVGSTTSSTSTVTFGAGSTVAISGTPTLASYTLMTASSFDGITPVLSAPVAGYELVLEGTTTLKLVQLGYGAWASLNGAGPNLGDDHDGDGVTNGIEYFIGGPNGNTTGFTLLPGVNTVGPLSITWPKGAGYAGAYGTDFVVETSATLSGVWTEETIPGGNITDTATEVKYTFPGPLSGKNFARLKVTGP